MDVLEAKRLQIEVEKHKAIGYRIKVAGEKEERKRKQKELNALVIEKQAELERFSAFLLTLVDL